jgi:hypothetical protein
MILKFGVFASLVMLTDSAMAGNAIRPDHEPKIYSVGTTSFSSNLTTGQSANIKVEGLGDLKDCKLELTVEGYVTNTGVRKVSMNGRGVYLEPFTVAFPADYPKNTYALISMVLRPVSGCALSGGGRENRLSATFPIWSGPAD